MNDVSNRNIVVPFASHCYTCAPSRLRPTGRSYATLPASGFRRNALLISGRGRSKRAARGRVVARSVERLIRRATAHALTRCAKTTPAAVVAGRGGAGRGSAGQGGPGRGFSSSCAHPLFLMCKMAAVIY